MSELRKAVVESRRLVQQVLPVLRESELSLEEWLVLDVLAVSEGLSMNEIGAATMASNATLSRHVDALVGRSLAYREVAFDDRRKLLVFLSPRGRALFDSITHNLLALADSTA